MTDTSPNKIFGNFLPVLLAIIMAAAGCVTRGDARTKYSMKGVTRHEGLLLETGRITATGMADSQERYTTSVEPDGTFELKLPAGRFYLSGTSTGPVSGRELFSFWAGNPLSLYGEITDVITMPFVEATKHSKITGTGGIKGQILFKGSPVEGAFAAAYLNGNDGFHGPPYALSEVTDAFGFFHLPVEPGTYYLIARKRPPGTAFYGPLLKGEFSGYYSHNPVTVRSGKGLMLDIALSEVKRPRGAGSFAPGRGIVIAGRVSMESGEPAAGVRVVLYVKPEMLGRPSFISSPADPEGNYTLEVSRVGKFYVAGRSTIGGPPETGDLMGFYSGSEDRSITLHWGDRKKNIDIVVREVW